MTEASNRIAPRMQLVFEALASPVRRKILAYLSHAELNAGEIASRFDMSKPSISQHLSILEQAGLISSEKRGKFVYFRQNAENIATTLTGFVQEICPVGRPLRKESAKLAAKRKGTEDDTADLFGVPPAKPARG